MDNEEKKELLEKLISSFSPEELEALCYLGSSLTNTNISELSLPGKLVKVSWASKTLDEVQITQLPQEERIMFKIIDLFAKLLNGGKTPLPSIAAKKAKTLTAPADRLSKLIFDDKGATSTGGNAGLYRVLGEECQVNTGRRKRGQNIYTLVTLNVDEILKYFNPPNIRLSPFDKDIHNAVLSLYLAGNEFVSPDMIFHAMRGYGSRRIPSEGILQDIREAMTKLMHTGIILDNQQLVEAYDLSKIKYGGHVISASYASAAVNGRDTDGWRILDTPPLYSLASALKQVNTVDIKLLDTGLSATKENITLTNYLLEQVCAMKNKKASRNTTILYSSVYEYLYADTPSANTRRKRMSDMRAHVKAILDAWVKQGFIAGHNPILDGPKITGVSISLA